MMRITRKKIDERASVLSKTLNKEVMIKTTFDGKYNRYQLLIENEDSFIEVTQFILSSEIIDIINILFKCLNYNLLGVKGE